MLFVLFWVIGQAEEIVRGHLIETGQPDQHIRGNIPLAQLVVAVDLLGAIQDLCQMLLLQIPVLPEVPYSLVHGITSGIGYHTAFCCIDKYRKMR